MPRVWRRSNAALIFRRFGDDAPRLSSAARVYTRAWGNVVDCVATFDRPSRGVRVEAPLVVLSDQYVFPIRVSMSRRNYPGSV